MPSEVPPAVGPYGAATVATITGAIVLNLALGKEYESRLGGNRLGASRGGSCSSRLGGNPVVQSSVKSSVSGGSTAAAASSMLERSHVAASYPHG
jgi:hypothetical protein